MKNLEYLDLSMNEITSLKGLKKQTKLTELYVNRNKLTGIKEAGHLSKLETLEAEQNDITSLQGTETLNNLTNLNISSNRLERLDSIQNMKKLRLLNVMDNRLKQLDEILYVKSLTSVFADFNRIKNLPDLTALPKLDYICFGYNLINEEESRLRANLPKAYFDKYEDSFQENFKNQNIDYSIDFKEPANPELIRTNTTRISGQIHMPAEKMELIVYEDYHDEEPRRKTHFLADVDENGCFVFEQLDLQKFAGKKCDLSIGIGTEYSEAHKQYTGIYLHSYKLKS